MPSPQTVSDASWVSELLWSLFVPFTVYQVRYSLSSVFGGREGAHFKVKEVVASALPVCGLVNVRVPPQTTLVSPLPPRHSRPGALLG